jgi:hypothetical protein
LEHLFDVHHVIFLKISLSPELDKLVEILEFSLKQPTPAGAGLQFSKTWDEIKSLRTKQLCSPTFVLTSVSTLVLDL